MTEIPNGDCAEGNERPSLRVVWTPVYGLGRSLIAAATLLTLVANNAETLFDPAINTADIVPIFRPYWLMSIFGLVEPHRRDLVRWISVFVLALVVIGWRPKITGILHWWICFSFAVSCRLPDGGDQIAAVISLLLVPVTLTDPRRWHWSREPLKGRPLLLRSLSLLAGSAMWVIRLQMCVVYLHSFVAKAGVREWADGTVLYYWFTHPVFGLPDWLASLATPLLPNRLVIVSLTWGAMVTEILLAMGIALRSRWWKHLLFLGIAFHFAILLAHGLVSFSICMIGALVLYLAPVDEDVCLQGA